MVIQIRGTNGSGKSTLVQQLIEKRHGRDIRLGRRLIGWNLGDTIVVRAEGSSQEELRRYIRHFAKQRHVVFEGISPSSIPGPYLTLAREVGEYLFAFMNTPLEVCLKNIQARSGSLVACEGSLRERWLMQHKHQLQLRNAGCQVVTLNYSRGVQQVEVLLLSARSVPGSYEPLTLPKLTVRRRVSLSAKLSKAA